MGFLNGKIKLGIVDSFRESFGPSEFTGYINELNNVALKEKSDFSFVFFTRKIDDFKTYRKNEQSFDEIMGDIINDKNTVNHPKYDVIFNVEYYAKQNVKKVNKEDIYKCVSNIVRKTGTYSISCKNVKILKHFFEYKKSIDVLDNLITINPSAIKYFYTDVINDKDADILTHSFCQYRLKKKDISKVRYTKEQILNKFDKQCKNDNLVREIERIYQIKDFKNIQGVNYLFNEDNVDTRERAYDVLANALYASGRVTNPYYFIIDIDVYERDIRPLLLYLETRLKISRNELYFFDFDRINDPGDPFGHNSGRDFVDSQSKFYDLIKKNQYTNTFGMYATSDAKSACESLMSSQLTEEYSFVEFSDKLNKEAQLQYVKEKIYKYNQMDLLPDITDIIEVQNKQYDGLTTSDLDDFILGVFKKKYEKVYKPAYKNVTKDMTKGNAVEKLMNMVGLKNLKDAVSELCNKVNFKNLNDELVPATKALNEISNFERNNWILTGVPGTGKSTAASMLEKIMYQEKIIKKDLIVKYTPSKRNSGDGDLPFVDIFQTTSNDIEDSFIQASGGVLIVDEIGHLSDKDKSLLLQLMEDNKKNVSVILCGYENEAKALLDFNPGFRSRFTHIIKLEEYTVEELYQILVNKLKEKKFYLKDTLKEKLFEIIKNVKGIPNFGQARFMESIADKLIGIHSSRKLKLIDKILKNNLNTKIGEKEIYEIDENDVDALPLDDMTGNEYSTIVKHKDAYNELNNLIGCNNVKQAVNEFVLRKEVDKIKFDKKLIDKSGFNMNMVFYGNPGTAKTTVARLVGKIMYDKGIINTPKITEVGTSDLVAGYVGQTAMKTANVFKKARGGVLFIDEAYSLANSNAGGYNQEAIDTIIREMENHRNDTLVIFAGYKKPMQEFINCNPGFKSRISKYIDFPSYSKDELIKIFMKLASDMGYTVNNKDKQKICDSISKYFDAHIEDENFGNGRECRTILENAINRQSKRLMSMNANERESKLMVLEVSDFVFDTNDFSKDNKKFIGFAA